MLCVGGHRARGKQVGLYLLYGASMREQHSVHIRARMCYVAKPMRFMNSEKQVKPPRYWPSQRPVPSTVVRLSYSGLGPALARYSGARLGAHYPLHVSGGAGAGWGEGRKEEGGDGGGGGGWR
jgi:hypothetical protein